ncbi:PP2C family protein-serine/threonine phosphatase [Streptosporangium sp. DT93]|uniref:PP2C family protein-serine/threonine phosphatase n=1 Tax=Streptosporangium sp. DT93 TaxID=3393428 RepID=UPI003CFA7D62
MTGPPSIDGLAGRAGATGTPGTPGTPGDTAGARGERRRGGDHGSAPGPLAGREPDERLLRAIVEECGEGIVVCDAAGVVVMRNAVAAELAPEIVPGCTPGPGAAAALLAEDGPEGHGRQLDHHGRRLLVRREGFGLAHRAWYLRDISAESARTDALLAERARATFLVEAGRRLSASLNVRRCARTAIELAVPFLADAAMVVLPPTGRRQADWLRLSVQARRLQEGAIALTSAGRVPGLAEALAGFPPVPSRWLDPGQVPGWVLPEDFGPAGHLIVTPLPGNGVPAGALVLARRPGGPAFDEDAETLVRLFAARAGAAISVAALYQEQSTTNAILSDALLPPSLPELEGVELAGSLRAARQAGLIGGDFYDVYLPESPVLPVVAALPVVPARPVSPAAAGRADPAGSPAGSGDLAVAGSPAGSSAGDRPAVAPVVAGSARGVMVVLGDVCGKGPRAAVLAGQVRNCLRSLLLVEHRPERLLPLLNRSLLGSPTPSPYVTLVLATLRPAPEGHLRVGLAVAGHPPPLILRRDGTVHECPARGSMLGALKQPLLAPAEVDLAPGELCLLYSDGITEAFGGPTGRQMYGEERLRNALAGCAGMPAAAVVERLEQISTDWLGGEVQDDRALLVVRARPVR